VIDQLYAGELIDYIRCIDIEYQVKWPSQLQILVHAIPSSSFVT
jgi:hypothetical protein